MSSALVGCGSQAATSVRVNTAKMHFFIIGRRSEKFRAGRYGSAAAPHYPSSLTSAIGGVKRPFDSSRQCLPNNEHPGYARCSIIQVIGVPQLPNLISRLLINQQGFYVDFGEHGLLVGLFHAVNIGCFCRNYESG